VSAEKWASAVEVTHSFCTHLARGCVYYHPVSQGKEPNPGTMEDGSQDASPGENPSTLEPAATPSNLQEEAPAAAEAQAGPPVASCSHLRLRGLPFQAGMQEVEAFFQQKQIVITEATSVRQAVAPHT
jgi:hypothetical protein